MIRRRLFSVSICMLVMISGLLGCAFEEGLREGLVNGTSDGVAAVLDALIQNAFDPVVGGE